MPQTTTRRAIAAAVCLLGVSSLFIESAQSQTKNYDILAGSYGELGINNWQALRFDYQNGQVHICHAGFSPPENILNGACNVLHKIARRQQY